MTCSNCGQPIKFITNKNKNKIPVRNSPEFFIPVDSGGIPFTSSNGDIRNGRPSSDGIKGNRLHVCKRSTE